MKILNVDNDEGAIIFYCEGCKSHHKIYISGSGHPIWSFNRDYAKPTIQPSIKVQWVDADYDENGMPIPETRKEIICHSFITDGKIQYLSDCTHSLAGQTIELPEID